RTFAAARYRSGWAFARRESCARHTGLVRTVTATTPSTRCSPPSGASVQRERMYSVNECAKVHGVGRALVATLSVAAVLTGAGATERAEGLGAERSARAAARRAWLPAHRSRQAAGDALPRRAPDLQRAGRRRQARDDHPRGRLLCA